MLMTKKMKNLNNKKPTVTPGVYNSVVKKVEFNPDYKDNTCLRVFYELYDSDGKTYEFKELFYNVPGNRRTEELGDYLENAGLDTSEISNLIGLREVVTIKWNIRGNNSYPSIVERKILQDVGDVN